jgi:1-acyl-sn-glycerol-3-phosphate acyltransferase
MRACARSPKQAMLVFRSLVFNVVFYLNLIVWMLVIVPVFFMPRKALIRVAQAWARSNLWLLSVITGTKVEFRGAERIPPGGLIVASKHQSLWETFALVILFDDPTYILKRELMWIPLFGWYVWKARMVPINRQAGSLALVDMNARAKKAVEEGRQILIFPEGTRRPAGAPPAYKYGFAHLYANLNVPCLPVALNSGLYWPRRQFIRRPGTIVVEILDPIPPGLPRDGVFQLVQEQIEAESRRLYMDGRAELDRLAPDGAATRSTIP